MEQTLQRGPRAGWQAEEADRLFAAVRDANHQGVPLRNVFEHMAQELGRKPNSIRNYYYAQLRSQPQEGLSRAVPFETFTDEEVHDLLRQVLIARGEGLSVRAAVIRMADGDRRGMLRYQNKYRAILKNKPHLIQQVAQELRNEGLPCPEDPTPQRRLPGPSQAELWNQAQGLTQALGDPAVSQMLQGLNTLLEKANRNAASEPLLQLDRLNVRYDLSRMAWEDQMNLLRQELEKLMALGRDFLALTPAQREGQLEPFCQALAMAIAQGEAAATQAEH
ncbi:MAG: hypothetical protein IJ461_00200 [Clostridia bacterium]|nr:hypothetical protein [Clostridia bacterium]